MAQINPNQLSIKQMEKVIEIYKEWYYQSEPIVRVNDEHSDVLSHPEKDPDLYNYLCDYQDSLFKEGLIESGLYDVYWYLVDYNSSKNQVPTSSDMPYSNEELEEWNSIQDENYNDYVLLFNMLNLKNYKGWADLIRKEGEQSAWCENMQWKISYFAKAYGLDYLKFTEAVSPSFDFYIGYFEEHPDVEVLGVKDEEANEKIRNAIDEIWNTPINQNSDEILNDGELPF